MKASKFYSLSAVIITAVFSALPIARHMATTEVITDVSRIVMRDTGNFTLLLEDSEKKKIQTRNVWALRNAEVGIHTDVPIGKPMWVQQKVIIGGAAAEIEIHIHSEKELEVAATYTR